MGVNYSRSHAPDAHCPPGSERRSSLSEHSDVMEQETSDKNESEEEFFEIQEDAEPRSHAQELVEFKKELAVKREQRRKIIAKHTSEKENLRNSLELQIKTNQSIRNENQFLRELLQQHNIEAPQATANTEVSELQGPVALLMGDLETFKEQNRKLRRDLADTNLALQSANSDMSNLQQQHVESMKQISALKEVVAVTKTMMKIRESQLTELKSKLTQIESSLADREASLLSADLRAEYERQLQNIRTLRALYEERARLADVTRLQLLRELDEQKVLAAVETSRCKELTDKVAELEAKITVLSDAIDTKDDQISVTKEESRGLKNEMSTVNKLFSQMLLGYKSRQDLDKLASRLEEHRGLLAHMVSRDEGSEASSALPKLLLELLGQADGEKGEERPEHEESFGTTAEEIVDNLPKVWRVLMELLSHQSGAEGAPGAGLHPSTCYKPVETPAGIRMVPSVSQTYIRLKDLIVEKLSLTKEMSKMKQLNAHLESRLEEQERRLCLVTSELSKTWHVVGRLRRHHHQLHTHEKILRYELQQKRKMLNELKEELEYCREKWDKAREKNTESEKQWRTLRNEFSSRKNKANVSLNNSGESGYSDERQTEDDSTESNDESECANDPPIRCKKRIKKTFDVLPDSSTDANPVAEGEDPISDMLDVADLPLDGLDVDEKDDELSTSESCVCENLIKSPCNLTYDGANCSKQSPSTCKDVNKIVSNCSTLATDMSSDGDLDAEASNSSASNSPEDILESIRKQNERVAKKDQRLNSLEESSASLLKQITKTTELRHNIDERLQKLRNRSQEAGPSDESTNQNLADGLNIESTNAEERFSVNNEETSKPLDSDMPNPTANDTFITTEPGSSKPLMSPKEILENIKRQNERLANRDERLKTIEEGCSTLLEISRNTLQVGVNLEARLDGIHSERNPNENSESEINNDAVIEDSEANLTDSILPETDHSADDIIEATTFGELTEVDAEPSTSTAPIDHEARFAARDVRLKRLEEQTKSLVDKVNDTATKTVKISYKLEELHNIYGSEGGTSRNQSPSDAEDGPDEAQEKNEGEP